MSVKVKAAVYKQSSFSGMDPSYHYGVLHGYFATVVLPDLSVQNKQAFVMYMCTRVQITCTNI